MKYLIEFRNGSYFHSLQATNGVVKSEAKVFDKECEAEKLMDENPWIYANGGMVVEK